MTNAKQAIRRSIAHNEIVHLEFSDEADYEGAKDVLLSECDDYAYASDDADTMEFWGGTGEEWRVHLKRCAEGSDAS